MKIRALTTFFIVNFALATTVFAQAPALRNGNFEAGTLEGWTASGVNEGFARIAREGSCFSYNNTEGLTLSGSFAAEIRSSGLAPTDSVGLLTSDPFIASSSISFSALSETEDGEVASGSES